MLRNEFALRGEIEAFRKDGFAETSLQRGRGMPQEVSILQEAQIISKERT